HPTTMPPLPSARQEASAAAGHFTDVQMLVGEQATRATVFDGLTGHSVAHLAVHGRAYPRTPLDSALVLAHDERISLRDLLPHQLPATRLAVLSSCDTSAVGLERPDEVVALPTGFLPAGACGVIGALWQVPDDSASVLMVRFYQLWRATDGVEPAEALRRAQIWLRDCTNADLPVPESIRALSS